MTLLWASPSFAAAQSSARTSAIETSAIDTHFASNEDLAPSIAFWYQLFVTHESDVALVHDRANMQVTWMTLELPKEDDGTVDERAAQHLMDETLEDVRQRLRRLARTHRGLDPRDRVLLRAARAVPLDALRGASRRVRVQRGVADRFRRARHVALAHLSDIKAILEEEGVPHELAALPFVESMFNPAARSSAGAAGIWQLMPKTARELGLTVRRNTDERFDIRKATRAAATMLRQNYAMLGSWPLALTAYNHGPYGVQRAVRAVGSSDLFELIEHYKKDTWGFASQNFYAEFIAVLHALADDPAISAQLAINDLPASSLPQ